MLAHRLRMCRLTMRWCLLATMALAAAGCGTAATVGPVASGPARPRLVEEASSTASVEATDRGPDEPAVVVVATSPTDIAFHAGAQDTVVPVRLARLQPTVVRARVHQGMWLGAGIGLLAGAVSGNEQDNYERAHPEANCDPLCGGHTIVSSAAVGAIGLGLGAAVGAIIGLLEGP